MLITTKTQKHGARKELQFYQVYGCSTAGVYAKGAGVYAKGAGVYAKVLDIPKHVGFVQKV